MGAQSRSRKFSESGKPSPIIATDSGARGIIRAVALCSFLKELDIPAPDSILTAL